MISQVKHFFWLLAASSAEAIAKEGWLLAISCCPEASVLVLESWFLILKS
jgi:hypothetical protein